MAPPGATVVVGAAIPGGPHFQLIFERTLFFGYKISHSVASLLNLDLSSRMNHLYACFLSFVKHHVRIFERILVGKSNT